MKQGLQVFDERNGVKKMTLTVKEKELLADDELGRRILRLQQEKEELMDTVWLATSPRQIKELWTTVSGVLDQEPTAIQKEAFSIDPMESIKE